MVEALRDEKESLLTQRAALKTKLEEREGERHPQRNYYRFDQEELLASAAKGEARVRGPQLSGEPLKVDSEARENAGLTAEEAAKVEAIFKASNVRVHDGLIALYAEIGGDASSLSTQTVFEELRSKALRNEFAEAVRLLADVRAGLTQRPAPGTGSAISRAFLLLDQEDQRTIAELEQLIGARRAEALLNDPKLSHSDHTFGVGPRKP